WRNSGRTQPWQHDTLVAMMSVTKSIAALCVLLLADRDLVDLDAPVARYWPDFSSLRKDRITVRHVLAQLAGLPYADGLSTGGVSDPRAAARAIEQQQPEWPAGSVPCYHSFPAGLLYAELVRRIDGRSLGRFLREEIAEPFGIDF